MEPVTRVWTAWHKGRPVGTKGTLDHAQDERRAWLDDGEHDVTLAFHDVTPWTVLDDWDERLGRK